MAVVWSNIQSRLGTGALQGHLVREAIMCNVAWPLLTTPNDESPYHNITSMCLPYRLLLTYNVFILTITLLREQRGVGGLKLRFESQPKDETSICINSHGDI